MRSLACPLMEEATAVIQSLEALLGAEPEVAEGFLLASVYVRALRTGDSPQTICENLFKSVPSERAWPALRDGLLAALEG